MPELEEETENVSSKLEKLNHDLQSPKLKSSGESAGLQGCPAGAREGGEGNPSPLEPPPPLWPENDINVEGQVEWICSVPCFRNKLHY